MWESFLIKFCKSFIKKRLKHRCFPVNIAKFSRTSILKNICGRLLLERQTVIFYVAFHLVSIKTDIVSIQTKFFIIRYAQRVIIKIYLTYNV